MLQPKRRLKRALLIVAVMHLVALSLVFVITKPPEPPVLNLGEITIVVKEKKKKQKITKQKQELKPNETLSRPCPYCTDALSTNGLQADPYGGKFL